MKTGLLLGPIIVAASLAATASVQERAKTTPTRMVPMAQVGPQPSSVNTKAYARIIHVASDRKNGTVTAALAAITDASPAKRYAVLRWGRVDLRRNVIVGNAKGGAHGAEGGVICVMEDNIIEDNGARRTPANPSFRFAAEIASRKFDPSLYVTEITTRSTLDKQDLSGGVVRIGAQWSVVKSSGPDALTLWGKITDEAAKVEALDQYVAQK